MAMDPNRGLLFLILQYLDKQNLSETARSLECEAGIYFNVGYFDELLNCCAYNEAENYLCGFTDIHDNIYSTKIYFGIRKLKFLEALADGEKDVARETIENDIEVFNEYNEGLVQQALELLEMENFMSHRLLSSYKNMKEARTVVLGNIKRCIEANPLLDGKLIFPTLPTTLQNLFTQATTRRPSSGAQGGPPATCRDESNE